MKRPTLAEVPQFAAAIDALGETTTAKAAALGYDRATLNLWLTDGLPKPLRMLLERPGLAAALAADAAQRDKAVISDATP